MDVGRYLAIRSSYGPAIRDDGKELAFLANTTGHAEIWSLEQPRGWPTQRTAGADAVQFCTYPPDRDELVFGRDEGGNERVQFYRLDPESGEVTDLTGHEDAKHYWGGWAHDAPTFTFSSNRRDESVFDLYLQSVDDAEAMCLHESDTWMAPAGFAPDDDRLLVHEMRASFDMDLYVYHRDDGSLEAVTDPDDQARYRSPQWSPDGSGIYCLTDEGADTMYLARIDCASHELEPVVTDDRWDLEGLTVDVETGRLAYGRNVDGFTELTVGEFADPTTIESYPDPGLPRGVAGSKTFGPDGERLAITHTSRRQNPSIYLLDVATGTVERWTTPSTAGIPPETFRTPDLVHVDSFDELEVPGFLTLPQHPRPDATPVIVDVHGGPESQRRPSFDAAHQYFLSSGYAVFEPNVRGSSGYGKEYAHLDDVERRMDSVADLAACADWLAAHDAIDPDRIVVKGGSYGGFMVLAALTEYPEKWAAGIDVVGIANFVTFLENTGSWRRSHREAEYGSLEEDRAFLESISPINSIERIQAPLFVIHGENDPRVPVGEAEQIAEAASEHVPVETLIFEDEGHGIAKLDNRITAYRDMVAFLDEHV